MTTWFVSRHPGAQAWAAAQGLHIDHCVSHLDVTQVLHGDTVVGTVPVHLAAAVCSQGACFLNISLDLPAHWRGRELSSDELRQCNARLECFDVRTNPVPLEIVQS